MTLLKENKQKNPALVTFASAFVPGLGQIISKKLWRGIAFFVLILISAFLTDWSFIHFNIGKIQISALTTTWLWLPVAIVWLWNIFDCYFVANNKTIYWPYG